MLSNLGHALRFSWKAINQQLRLGLFLCAVSMIASSVLTGIAPVAFAHAIDALGADVDQHLLTYAIGLIATYGAVQWLSRSLSELRTWAFGCIEHRIANILSERAFAHLQSLPVRAHTDRRLGEVSHALTTGITAHRVVLQHLSQTVAPTCIEFITIAALLLSLTNSTIALLTFCVVALCAAIFWWGTPRLVDPTRAATTHAIDAHAILTDSLINYEPIKSLGAEHVQTRLYREALGKSSAALNLVLRRRSEMSLSAATAFYFCLAAILVLGAVDVANRAMTVGDLVLVHTYAFRLITPLHAFGDAVQDITEGTTQLQRLIALMEEPPEERGGDLLRPTMHPGRIAFHEISFSYVPNCIVLDRVSFTIAAGSSVAIVGASGTGKSSLVRLMLRLFEPDSGSIFLDDQALSTLSLGALREAIAVVPQDTVLLHSTIEANIAVGKPGCSREEIERAAEIAGLANVVAGLPEGYDTIVGPRGLRLSGGERQRLAIARAVIRQPRVYVLDEATSSLDGITEQRVLRRLRRLTKQTTTLLITHRLASARHADDILVFDKGRLVERGTHNGLKERGGYYAQLWQSQHSDSTHRFVRPETST
jgi:ATP-binding cassette, subfamily B, heavy metal transporter